MVFMNPCIRSGKLFIDIAENVYDAPAISFNLEDGSWVCTATIQGDPRPSHAFIDTSAFILFKAPVITSLPTAAEIERGLAELEKQKLRYAKCKTLLLDGVAVVALPSDLESHVKGEYIYTSNQSPAIGR